MLLRLKLAYYFYWSRAKYRNFKGPGFYVIDPNGQQHIVTTRGQLWKIAWRGYGKGHQHL
jgi:hypothetical protein